MKLYFFFIPLFFLLAFGCKTSQQVADEDEIIETAVLDEVTEERFLDTMVVTAPMLEDKIVFDETEDFEVVYELPTYNPSEKRTHDLIHTKLELSFNWEEELVIGKATLNLKPYFYPSQFVSLDAKGFTVNEVKLLPGDKSCEFEYDGKLLTIDLGQTYTKKDTFTVMVDYIAKPRDSGQSGFAITSDRGLFFVNPRGEEQDKPKQIWTQGETEWNSKWFPTIDHPNERTTQEIYLTVMDNFKTLSNGLLLSSDKNNDGTRTDYWKFDQPHAPYLFMVAVGEFAVVEEEWEGIPLSYYVEPEYETSAKAIFAHTPEMLDFFSDKLKLKYPWPKYAQIIVRDYVSGAMENTSAVVFGDFVQKHEQELIDNHNDGIVAHEMFHHWFGDYVTCESWANLTMNEGFANYSEYLWYEHKYGREEADYHLLNEWKGYLDNSSNWHDLIYFDYDDKEDMFDAHSYNKGGAVLHMLRKYVGDEAFWAALNKYLNDHAYESVEVHDLRLAFEEVTGEDLNWFFNQWYLESGHPELEIKYDYDEDNKEAIVSVTQLQEGEGIPGIFVLPVDVDIYFAGQDKPLKERVTLNQREQEFRFKLDERPALVSFDAERALLGEITHFKSDEEFQFQYEHSDLFLDRFDALTSIQDDSIRTMTLKKAINDDFWYLRGAGIQSLSAEDYNDEMISQLRNYAVNDPKSQIRALCLSRLFEFEDPKIASTAASVIENDKAYTVIATALDILIETDKEMALNYATQLENVDNDDIIDVLGALYAESKDPNKIDFFTSRLEDVDGFAAISLYQSYQMLAAELSDDVIFEAIENFEKIALSSTNSSWRKLSSAKSVNDMRNYFRDKSNATTDEAAIEQLESKVSKISEVMDRIIAAETNPQIKSYYETKLLLNKKE